MSEFLRVKISILSKSCHFSQSALNCFWPKLCIANLAKRFHGFPFPQSCLKKRQHFQHSQAKSQVKMCPQKRHCFFVFFFLLNKIKCLRWWVSNSHLSKSTGGFKVLLFFSIFKKEISCFRVSLFYLNWDSTQHLNQLSFFRQFWIGFDSP